MDYTDCFSNAESAMNTWDKSHLVMVCDIFIHFKIWFTNDLLVMFTPLFMRDTDLQSPYDVFVVGITVMLIS